MVLCINPLIHFLNRWYQAPWPLVQLYWGYHGLPRSQRYMIWYDVMWCDMIWFTAKPAILLALIYDRIGQDTCYDMIWYYMIWHDMKWNGMAWFGVVWCGVLWYDMIWYGMVWYGMVWYDDMIWYDMIWYDMIWYDMIWYDMIWYDMIWYDMIWYDMVYHTVSDVTRASCEITHWHDMILLVVGCGISSTMCWRCHGLRRSQQYDLICDKIWWYDMMWYGIVYGWYMVYHRASDMICDMWHGIVWYHVMCDAI